MQGVSLSGTEFGWFLPEPGGGGVPALGRGGYLTVAAPVGMSRSAITQVCSAQDEARLLSAMVQLGQDSGFGKLMVAKASMRGLLMEIKSLYST